MDRLIEIILAEEHLYLLGCALFVPVIVAGYLAVPGSRRLATLAGLGVIPAAPFASFLQETYWSPVRIGGGAWGIEDVLFSFASGVIVWWAAILPIARRLLVELRLAPFLKRYLAIISAVIVVFLALVAAGVDAMTALLVIQLVIALAFAVLVPDYRAMQLSGLILFPAFYAAYFAVLVVLTSGAVYATWQTGALLAVDIFGLPIGEALYALTFAASYPTIVASSAGVRVAGKGAGG